MHKPPFDWNPTYVRDWTYSKIVDLVRENAELNREIADLKHAFAILVARVNDGAQKACEAPQPKGTRSARQQQREAVTIA